ncbi:alpha/beta fold hydrolase [Rhodococcus jostii]|uniref:alpha/beta fold hydrolase n=1 Tax=Rhodococcus jostii TaxID=132919 RepID=UPI0036458E5C
MVGLDVFVSVAVSTITLVERKLMPYIQSGDVKLHYRDSGEGYPLLFGHGFFMDSEMFAPQLRALNPTHRVLAWDAREHGDTEAPDTVHLLGSSG